MKKIGRKKKSSPSYSTSLWVTAGVLLAAILLAVLGPDANESKVDVEAAADAGADEFLSSTLDLARVPEDKRDELVSITRKAMGAAKDGDMAEAQALLESAAAIGPCLEVDQQLGRLYFSQAKSSNGAFNGRLLSKAHKLFKQVYDHAPTTHKNYGALVLPYANTLHYLEPGQRHANVYAVLEKCKSFKGCQRMLRELDSEYARVDKEVEIKQQAQDDIDAKPELAAMKGSDAANAGGKDDTILTDDDMADL